MITHTIITHKPKFKYKHQQQQNIFPVAVHNAAYPHNAYDIINRNYTKQEIEKYVAESAIAKGDFVVYSYKQQIDNYFNIHYVLDVDTTTGPDAINWDRSHPCIFRLLQICWEQTNPYKHWESRREYRKLTDEEYDKWILPNIDLIRNHIEKHAAEAK